MVYFKICPWCGAALDPGEICDCEGAHQPITETSIGCPSGNFHRDNHDKNTSIRTVYIGRSIAND